MHFSRLFYIFALSSSTSLMAAPKQYKVYPYDPSPFQKHADIGKAWEDTRLEWKDKVAPLEVMKQQALRLEALSAREPNWIDGYWLTSDANFQTGNSYKEPKDFPTARAYFEKGKLQAETCLKKQGDNPLCKFYLGVNMGKMASIDGIFSSLKSAKIIERLWTEVLDSPYNHQWGPNTSLQGADRYALGMFYRLVPDFFLMKWLFGVKGDISKSVAMHKENLEFDAPNVCSKTMLAVSLICKGGSNFSSSAGAEGLAQLKQAKTLPVTSALYASCSKDVVRLEGNAKLACGYETSRQQETSEEEFNKKSKETASAH